jgi:hypothetical protein
MTRGTPAAVVRQRAQNMEVVMVEFLIMPVALALGLALLVEARTSRPLALRRCARRL